MEEGNSRSLQNLAAFLEAQPAEIIEYSDALVRRLIDTITVYDEKLVSEFKADLSTQQPGLIEYDLISRFCFAFEPRFAHIDHRSFCDIMSKRGSLPADLISF